MVLPITTPMNKVLISMTLMALIYNFVNEEFFLAFWSIGGGSSNFHEGKRELSFLMKGRSSEVWNVGNMFGVLGSSIVTLECFSLVSMTLYGPL